MLDDQNHVEHVQEIPNATGARPEIVKQVQEVLNATGAKRRKCLMDCLSSSEVKLEEILRCVVVLSKDNNVQTRKARLVKP